MKISRKVWKAFAGAGIAVMVLAGCSAPEEEPVPQYTGIPESSPTGNTTDIEATSEPTTDPTPTVTDTLGEANLPESVHGQPIAVEVEKATEALLAAAAFMEGNKVEGGYDQWLYYATAPGDTIRMRILPNASSPESYCLQATSQEDPDLSILYDSQPKKVLADGEHCKPEIGTAWESADGSENDQSTTDPSPGEAAPTG